MKIRKTVSIGAYILIAVLLAWRLSTLTDGESTEYPNQPIQIVVPYSAGGGGDTFTRIMQKTVAAQGKLEQPLVIINQPGGGGTIGSRFAMDSRPDGYRILYNHEALITSELSGTVSFGPDDFVPVAQTGSVDLLILTRADSPYNSIKDLLEAAKEKPNSIRFGADVGSPAHFNAMVMERTVPGSAFNYISTGGGQKRLTMILGGHLEAGIFSLAEYIGYRGAEGTPDHQNVKAITNLNGKRNPVIPEVGTSIEQGVQINTAKPLYWWAPLGTPAPVVDRLADVFNSALNDPEMKKELSQLSIETTFRKGEELQSFLDARETELSAFAVSFPSGLPNFPAWVIGIVAAILIVLVVEHCRKPKVVEVRIPLDARMALMTAACLIAYLLCLQFGIAYVLATPVAVFLIGGTIGDWKKEALPSIAQMGLLFALGSEYVFTEIFSVPLP